MYIKNSDELEAFEKLKAEKHAEGKEVWVLIGSFYIVDIQIYFPCNKFLSSVS